MTSARSFPLAIPTIRRELDAEYGRSRLGRALSRGAHRRLPSPLGAVGLADLRVRLGQPWNHRLGYDFNGDGKNSDRPSGVGRNSEDGPAFRQLSLRLTKGFRLLTDQRLEVIAEAFNVFNTTNYDVNSDRRRGIPLRPDAGQSGVGGGAESEFRPRPRDAAGAGDHSSGCGDLLMPERVVIVNRRGPRASAAPTARRFRPGRRTVSRRGM